MAAGVLRSTEEDAVATTSTVQHATAAASSELDHSAEPGASLDSGMPRMTPALIEEICLANQGFRQPDLNDALMLNYKGFRVIENLQPYINVTAIWLGCNGIHRIEGLQGLPKLSSLYLESNCIKCIENLVDLPSLHYLNLSNNSISHVDNLADLPKLESINLAGNRITEVAGLEGLTQRQSLRTVHVSQNYIEDGEAYMAFWERALPDVQCLYLHQNPCSRTLKNYRRRMVSSLKCLRWLDDRPVWELERVGAEAWAVGGKDAENEAKRNHILQERAEKERSFNNFQRVSKACAARFNAQKEAKQARESACEDVEAELRKTDSLAEGWVTWETKQKTLTSTLIEDPSQQPELHAKVQSFLASRGKTSESEAAPEVSETAETDVPAEALEVLSGDETAEVPDACDEDVDMEFRWSAFRDKRLGSLASECRYDFKKVASLLSEEFACVVHVDACRQRYGELIRPGSSKQQMQETSGRARDAPEMDATAVQEVSNWWVRQLCRGGSRQSEKPTKEVPRDVRAERGDPSCLPACLSSSSQANLDDSSGEEPYLNHQYRQASGLSGGDMNATSMNTLGNLAGDMDKYSAFAPPRRTSLPDTYGPSEYSAGVGVARAQVAPKSELFELD
jgi:dynein assembly factor 1